MGIINIVIREGRRRLGMSETQFAESVGVTRGAVQQWEKVNGTAPKRATQPKVAEVLGISVAELMTGPNEMLSRDGRSEVPLVTAMEAASYAAFDHFKPALGTEMVPINVKLGRRTFALRVHGDSMVSESNDSFPEGSVVIVEPDLQAIPDDYVIVKNAAGETTFKQLIKDAGEYYLKPLNLRYPIRPLDGGEIIGVVREFSKVFR